VPQYARPYPTVLQPHDLARFWSLVKKTDGCWLWQGVCHPYGRFVLREQGQYKAHRLAYALTYGPFDWALEVCHNCPGGDNPACVNPAHMFLGDHAANMGDAGRKGRASAGERTRHAALTVEQVAEIRDRYAEGGTTQRDLAGQFGIDQSVVSRLVRGEIWQSAEGDLADTCPRQERNAKLTEDQVRAIRCRYQAGGISMGQLAREYGVVISTIHVVVHRKHWQHVS